MAFPFPNSTPRDRWRYSRLHFDDAWCTLAGRLTTADYLEVLNIIVPVPPDESNYFCGVQKRGKTWSAFDDLTVTKPFLEMHITVLIDSARGLKNLPNTHCDIVAMLKELAVCRVHLAKFGADEEGSNGRWKLVKQPFVDKRGRFTLLKDMDRSVEVIDVLLDMERLFAGKWAK
ncbi:hypothetical protein CC86DRAFT_410200 [Ophiobolus disseminans]|uniref:Uncharacterized protein n=1 Tax=Ophiobolus disseminans TaxID=1469910 RepID=A0A6A6ZQ99_9PLEO|nr:hypothetical protein CC86DRAFT_410200 [Ophiobolus disseminans]